jgi:hypothetical protein
VDTESQLKIEALQRKIGELTMEMDFLKKVSSRLA